MDNQTEVVNAAQEPSGDPAAVAFESLREEVALVRRAIAGLAAERAANETPDYSEALGQIMRATQVAAAHLRALAAMPALRLTANNWSQEIAVAGENVRQADHHMLTRAIEALQIAARDIGDRLHSARDAERQNMWLLVTGIGGVLVGIFLWVVLVGPRFACSTRKLALARAPRRQRHRAGRGERWRTSYPDVCTRYVARYCARISAHG